MHIVSNTTSYNRWISYKEIDPTFINRMRLEAIEKVCLIEKIFPTSIMTLHVHVLVHLVDEIALAGIVHTRWMFFWSDS